MPVETVSITWRSRYVNGAATRPARASSTLERKVARFTAISGSGGKKLEAIYSLFLRLPKFSTNPRRLSTLKFPRVIHSMCPSESILHLTSMPKRVPDDSINSLFPLHASLDELRKASKNCKACDLWKLGTQTVFGEGMPTAKIMPLASSQVIRKISKANRLWVRRGNY